MCWIIGLSIAYSALSIIRHNHFQSGGFDLGLYDQAVWQYSKFIWPYNTVKERFILGDHLTLTLPLLAPLYWLWNDVRILLIFQAFWVSISSFAVYTLALRRKLHQFTSLVVAIGYGLFYGIQYTVFFDFHPVVMAVGFIPWLLYFLESGRVKLLVATTILLLFTQENMGLALSSIGIFYLVGKRYRRIAIMFIIGGIVWSLVAAWIIALFSPIGFQYWPHITLDPISVFRQFFDNPEKRETLLYTFSSFSFIPLFSLGSMLAIFFDLAQYFVTGPEFSRMWSPFMHHRITLAPLVILGVLDVFERLQTNKKSLIYLSFFLFFWIIGNQYFLHLPLNKLSKQVYWQEEPWMKDTRALLSVVPINAAIATQQNLIPHLSHKKEIYLVYPRPHDYDDTRCGQRSCWWLDFNNRANYLVVDLRPDQWLTQILESNEHYQEAVRNMEKAGKIRLTRQIGYAKIYEVIGY